ncbi:MAG TPA: hypothetical protein VLG67_00580 [Candidatus Saccharimonadales bacterium]|nr:hypothetical protein [Candidatus Saccharimonadales bacterium]
MRNQYIGITILGIFVLIVCIVGFSIIGTPISQKAIRFDETRISGFTTIKTAVEDYYSTNKQLPISLSELKFTYAPEPKDPESKESYKYEKVTSSDYKLCSTFSTDSEEVKKKNQNSYPTYYYGSTNENVHKKGNDCIKYSLPTYLIPYSDPTPTPQPAIFQFLKPERNETLCLGETYEIEWLADPKIKEVDPYIESTVNGADLYLLAPANPIPSNNFSGLNASWKGSRSWIVGDVFESPSSPLSKIKPGRYKFGNSTNKYINALYSVYSTEFTISDCTNSSKLQVSN